MSTIQSVKNQIQTLIDNANATTGKSDADLTTAQASLISGYGVGSDPILQTTMITENGTYTPDGEIDGFSQVVVNVQPTLQEKTVTENGEVTPDNGYDGLLKVTVNVESNSGVVYRNMKIDNIFSDNSSEPSFTCTYVVE